MYVADTLSQAYLPNSDASAFVHSLESTDHTISVSLNAGASAITETSIT